MVSSFDSPRATTNVAERGESWREPRKDLPPSRKLLKIRGRFNLSDAGNGVKTYAWWPAQPIEALLAFQAGACSGSLYTKPAFLLNRS